VPEHQNVKLVAEPATAVLLAPAAAVTEPAPPPALELQAFEVPASLATVDAAPNGHGAEWGSVFDRPVSEPLADASAVEAIPETAVAVSAPAAETTALDAPAEAIASAAPATPAEPQSIPAAPAQTPPVWAKPQAQPNGGRPYFFAQASKGSSPAEAPAAAATVTATVEAPAPPAASKAGLEVDDRPELESLSFPKDGLSRQWLEFLSQLGATK
jgi:hypothetical protein